MKYSYSVVQLFYITLFSLILLDSTLQQIAKTPKTLDLNEGTVFFLHTNIFNT